MDGRCEVKCSKVQEVGRNNISPPSVKPTEGFLSLDVVPMHRQDDLTSLMMLTKLNKVSNEVATEILGSNETRNGSAYTSDDEENLQRDL